MTESVNIVSPKKAGSLLNSGKIGVVPAESVYGLMASALNKHAVERVYQVKTRPSNKPCIVLIALPEDMALFGIDKKTITQARAYWPGKVSVVVPCPNPEFLYLSRGKRSLAFRVPSGQPILQKIIASSGPLIAPTANPHSLAPATTVQEAYDYFGNNVDFYVDGGLCNGAPSRVVSLTTGHVFRK